MPRASSPLPNSDPQTVAGFGDEWKRFDQAGLGSAEGQALFEAYFNGFPWSNLDRSAQGFDAGCGSGRWAKFVAPRVGWLHCIDASADALEVARETLREEPNCSFHHASVGDLPFEEGSMDFGYSLGVLHHVPDTAAAIRSCARVLRSGAPFLVYLYYAMDNKPRWYRGIWRGSDLLRRVISKSPHPARYAISQIIAAAIYWPLARTARVLERAGANVANLPLSMYRDRSFYTMRTDALDRFGTRLEQRFTKEQVGRMMEEAGFQNVRVLDEFPFWRGIGYAP
jgi:ubiquinone/menaquinone biosynthesis C-methylase UbiE